MASDIKNVKLGICKVLWDVEDSFDPETPDYSSFVNLGYTKGGVSVNVTTETYESTVDQFGNTPIAEQIIGRRVEVTAPFAESTLENFEYLMPMSKANTSEDRVDVRTGVGTNLLDQSHMLILRPNYMGDESTEDFVVWRAATAGGLEFAYSLDGERIFNVTFKGYPDMERNEILFSYGDSAAEAASWT